MWDRPHSVCSMIWQQLEHRWRFLAQWLIVEHSYTVQEAQHQPRATHPVGALLEQPPLSSQVPCFELRKGVSVAEIQVRLKLCGTHEHCCAGC